MINIYDKTETVFNHSGLATLEPTECIFAPMINDVWKLEMTIPYDSEKKYRYIANDCFLRVTDLDAVSEQSSTQLFRIYDFKKQDDSIYVLAYPVGLDARFDTYISYLDLLDHTGEGAVDASDAIAAINGIDTYSPHKYTLTTNLTSSSNAEFKDVNIISALNGNDGFVQKWGGEICYDNYTIKVNSRIGNPNSQADVRYGKNIQSMTIDVDESNVVTRLYPKSSEEEALNAIENYKIGNTPYVDSPKFSNYPIAHNYYVDTPYKLVQMSNDGSWEYWDTMSIYEDVYTLTYNLVEYQTDLIMDINSSSANIDLEWIKWFYSLTMDNDGTEGFAERIARLASYLCVSDKYKEMIKKAVKAGFKGYFDTVDAKYVWEPQTNWYIYYPNNIERWRWHGAWAKEGNTWKRINADGHYIDGTSAEDNTEWKWFKTKGIKYKRYGNKKKNYYLRNGLFKINNVWYWFDNNGKSYKGKKLFTEMHFDAMYDSIAASIISSVSEISLETMVEQGERRLYTTLYTQMTDYCNSMYTFKGVDSPTVNIEIDMVDLSKTSEYSNYQNLLKVHLGDTVSCVNYKYGYISLERIIGIEYDVLRGFNRKVTIGATNNSVISMLTNINNNNDTKLVAGEGVEINNNVISIIPSPAIRDVIVNGESVVSGDVASFEINQEYEDGGLEYFEETEHTLTGDNEWQETIVEWSTIYNANPAHVKYDLGNNNYKVEVTANPSDTILCATLENVLVASVSSYSVAAVQGCLLMSKNTNDLTATWHYVDPNGGEDNTGTCTYAQANLNNHTLLSYELYAQSGTATVNGDTWYGLLFYLLHGGLGSDKITEGTATSVNYFIGSPGDIPTYGNLSAFISDFADAIRTTRTETHYVYSGLARTSDLAFFAGGTDDEGTNAPLQIFSSGDYKGITKAVELTYATYDALSETEKNRADRVYFITDYPSVVEMTTQMTISSNDYGTATFTEAYLISQGVDTAHLSDYLVDCQWMSSIVNTAAGSNVWHVNPISISESSGPSYLVTSYGGYTVPMVRVFTNYIEVVMANVQASTDTLTVKLKLVKVG